MKKITCFTESLGGGGAEHQIALLSGMLAEKGYDVTLVTYASLPDYYDTPKHVKRIDIGATCFTGKKLKAFIKILKVFHFFLWLKTDCVISYRECANLRVLPPMFFRSRKIKVICSDRNASTVMTLRHKILLHFLYRRADSIVPNSLTETNFILKNKSSLEPKIFTIHNYTDLQSFVFSEVPPDLSVIKIAIFSRFSAQKNFHGFAVAIRELKRKAHHSFEVHWYGNKGVDNANKDICGNGIEAFINDNQIEDVLIIHPPVKNPNEEMCLYHAVSLPSLYEGFSNSVAEGICCGKPMLVSDVSDNSIMVHDGENGFLFDPTDTESICSAFLKFFDLSYSEMCRMSKRSREIAEELFDKDAFIKHYIDLIEA